MDLSFCEEDFNKNALEIFNMSEILNDNWIINEKNGKFYLKKSQMIRCNKQQQQQHHLELESDNDPSMTKGSDEEIICIEYHALFHPSYQVPALYFNAYSDGSLISLSDISKIFVENFEFRSCRDQMLNIVTQSEHPILFRPYFMIHPCKISQVLSKFPESKNPLLTFLTIFGPSVQLQMKPGYEKFFFDPLMKQEKK